MFPAEKLLPPATDEVKLTCPVVNAGPPLRAAGATDTLNAKLSTLTPDPNDRLSEHDTAPPAAAPLGQPRLIEFCPHNGAPINRLTGSHNVHKRRFNVMYLTSLP